MLEPYYNIGVVTPVDLFPNSEHIEDVVVLTKKQ